ncbi:MAG: radical SAM protein [Patescibacteria group bacterium]|nr:radical SAM protein [Patescibacteria group bacterium]
MPRKLKIAVTTKCPLSCSYCFARKDDKIINLKKLRETVQFFFANSTKTGRLIIFLYGGEPCLFPELLKSSIYYILKEAKDRKRDVFVCVGTNGIMLTSDLISFFKKHQVGIAFSFGGKKDLHDKFRHFQNKKGSFEKAIPKLKLLIDSFPADRYYVALCLHPLQAGELYESFLYFYSLGVRSFRMEWINDERHKWDEESVALAKDNYIKIWDYIVDKLSRGNFIFLVNFLETPLKNAENSQQPETCFNTYEVSTSGKVFLSPFLTSSDNFAVGDVRRGLKKDLFACNMDNEQVKYQDCTDCRRRHFGSIHEIISNLGKIEDEFRVITNKYLKKISTTGRNGKEYINTLYKNFPF